MPTFDRPLLQRAVFQWAKMRPKKVAEGSQAQVVYALQDAQHDIAALASEVASLRGVLHDALALVEEYAGRTAVAHIASECDAVLLRGRATMKRTEPANV